MSTNHLATRIAGWVCGLDAEALSDEVVAGLRRAVLDCLAAILSGVPEPVTRHVVEHVTGTAKGGQATIIGHRARATAPGAALANGTMGHACDYDDSSFTMWGHPTAPSLPAALAVAETRNLSGREFLVALAVALEVEKALGIGCQPEHYARGWHTTGTLGVFGAAAGAAKALALDREGVAAALGIAASRAASLKVNSGTMTKPLHAGFAARDGVEAALLAGMGVTASPRALDGRFGFFEVYAPDHRAADSIVETLGNPFEVVEPGLSPKLYPCCSQTHAAVDAVLALRDAHGLDPASVGRVRCGISAAARADLVYSDPKTPLEAKFSQEYCIAAALARGRLGMREFDPDTVDDPAIRRLMKRVEVSVHPELAGAESITFSSPAIVEVETADGRTFERRVREMRGHPDNPLSAEDLEAKFVECGARVLDPRSVRRAMDRVNRLDAVPRVRDLLRDLTPAVAAERSP